MFSAVYAGGLHGMEAYLVRVEVDISRGLPGFELVGSVAGDVKEAKERVTIALKNAGISLPVAKITVNLSPADIRKEGSGYDMAIAAGLLACMGICNADSLQDTAFLGELALNGEVNRVNGILPIALALQKKGIKTMLVPEANEEECGLVPGISLIGIPHIKKLLSYVQTSGEERNNCFPPFVKGKSIRKAVEKNQDFADVYGQESAKRAAEIATAGFHHLMIAGAPGTGKTMIAERIPQILPPLSDAEQLEVFSIYSIAGKLKEMEHKAGRPFVSPHHTSSPQALAGGGRIPKPGLLSLSHRGILFLDEMPEFSQRVLEVLRQPLEEKQVQIARSGGTYVYPADFMLVCAMNPCPCGYYPDRNRCTCTESDIRRYLGRISGPILDRIDIFAEAEPVQVKDFHRENKGEKTEVIRERVMEARERQKIRYGGSPWQFNGELPGREVERYCKLGAGEQRFLEEVFESGQMSVRCYHKVIKLARTVADLAGKERIAVNHLAEAVYFNSGKQRFWR